MLAFGYVQGLKCINGNRRATSNQLSHDMRKVALTQRHLMMPTLGQVKHVLKDMAGTT